jgi:hypothetical protein
LLLFYFRINTGFLFRNKLQVEISFGHVVIYSEPSDFYKPAGQNMLGKPSQELNAIECNGFPDGPVAIIFGNKSYFVTGDIQDAVIADCHAMGVLSQVSNHVFGACQRWFAMYHPPGFISCLHLIVKQ